jgi:hypothetical protein
MNSLAAILTPLALLLPAIPAALPHRAAPVEETAQAAPDAEKSPRGFAAAPLTPLRMLEEARRPPLERQVRLEQRVIIRIAPSSPQRMEQSLAQLNRRSERFEEVRLRECVPINMIAAVAPQENRLLLFMRDRRILSVALERSCNPEDFYSGFYIERQDGNLCERRDRLQSRAGASCRVTRLNRLVAARD